MLCDGSKIKEGPWKGKTTPDINTSKRFLRGNTVSNVLNLETESVNTKGLSVKDRVSYIKMRGRSKRNRPYQSVRSRVVDKIKWLTQTLSLIKRSYIY